MTDDDLLAAGILDARKAYADFEATPTEPLRALQLSLQVDQAHATTPEAIAFGGGRLALIAAVLGKRATDG